MKNLLFLLSVLFFVQIAVAQEFSFAVYLTDKDGTAFSIDNPEEFLSQRAIERRQKYNIAIVEQDLPVSQNYIETISSLGFEVGNCSKWLNVAVVNTDDSSSVSVLSSLDFVDSIACVKVPSKKSKGLGLLNKPNDMASTLSAWEETKTSFDYGSSENQIAMINGISLHNDGYCGENIIISVLDAGFKQADVTPCFDILFNDGRVVATKDFVTKDGNVYANETSSHGTYVLSTMAAELSGIIVGTAPKASYYLLRTEDAASEYRIEEYNWVSGAEYADSVGTDVINSSLGYTTFDAEFMDYTYADMDGKTTAITIGAEIAVSKGILVVNSAGNAGGSSWEHIGAPADGPNVFSIGAVTPSGDYASFSSTGPNAVGVIKPNVTAQGQSTVITQLGVAAAGQGNGTSFSGPIIAGMSACLLQILPETSPAEIRDAIQKSASQYSTPDSLLGYGIPNYQFASSFLSVEQNKISDNDFSIFPNPATSFVLINSEINENVDLKIFSIEGRLIVNQEKIAMPYSLDVQSYKSGVYLVQLITSSGVGVQRLVVE